MRRVDDLEQTVNLMPMQTTTYREKWREFKEKSIQKWMLYWKKKKNNICNAEIKSQKPYFSKTHIFFDGAFLFLFSNKNINDSISHKYIKKTIKENIK